MDTDYLTETAYEVLIGRSGEVSEFLRAEIGTAASHYPNEDAYLGAMHWFVSEIARYPADYLDSWNLLEEVDPREFGPEAAKLAEEIMDVLHTPLEERGPTPEW